MMNRKEFIRSCGLACCSAVAGSMLLTGCSPVYTASFQVTENKLIVSKQEFFNAEKNLYRPYALVRPMQLALPIIVYRFSEQEYRALSLECTHRSCELEPQGDYLVCPCHGSEFDNSGKVLSPPADMPLKSLEVTVNEKELIIQL